MGNVVLFKPKSLVNFEENALVLLARLSQFFAMSDTVYAIAGEDPKARAGIEIIRELGEAIDASIEVLTFNAEVVSFMEEIGEGIKISVESDKYPWRVIFTVSVRCSTIWVKRLEFSHVSAEVNGIPMKLLHIDRR